jgi:hypothetical protein
MGDQWAVDSYQWAVVWRGDLEQEEVDRLKGMQFSKAGDTWE